MYSTWYLFPGQTEKNTKFEDRGKALVCTPEGWSRLTSHLDKDKKRTEMLEEEKARKQYLKEESHNMTKNWDNSIEKIQQRRLEETLQRIEAKKQEKVDRYIFLRNEQQLERQEYVEKAKKQMYMFQEEKSRELNSAFLLSQVLYEREAQIKFNEHVHSHDNIDEMLLAQQIKRAAEEEKMENNEKECKRREKNMAHKKELLASIENKISEENKLRIQSIEDGRIDNLRAEEEMQAIKQYYIQKEKEKKEDVKKQFHDFEKVQQHLKEQMKNDEMIEDKIISIYSNAKCRINSIRKEKEEQMKEEKIRIREEISKKVKAKQDSGEAKEKEILENALREFKEREDRKFEADKQHQKDLRDERIQGHLAHVKEQQENERRKAELEKWDLLNRLKTQEVLDKYDEDSKRRAHDRVLKQRADLLQQMADNDRARQHEVHCKEEELKYYRKKLDSDDQRFFSYAGEMLATVQQKGQSKEPVLRVVERYKVDNGLQVRKKNTSFLNSNVPIDQ